MSALVCTTFVSPQATNCNKQTLQPQDNVSLDFKPFAPDYQSTNLMPVSSNLPQVKDCEFDHAYILNIEVKVRDKTIQLQSLKINKCQLIYFIG